jgi:hypothetical protein
MNDLVKRAVACKRWRWMPGMLSDEGSRILSVSGRMVTTSVLEVFRDNEHDDWDRRHESADIALFRTDWPDLNDPATLGCLFALVREAWDPSASIVRRADGWTLETWNTDNFLPDWPLGRAYPTEAEALVAALEVDE